jgi:lipopolysaccharide assembly protein A
VSYTASGTSPERAAEERPPVDPATGARDQAPTATTPPTGTPEIPRTWTARAFTSLIAFSIVLILLLVFILENTERVKISYFGDGFHLPLGVALLLAAIGGALLTGIVGAARIVQLRRHVRRGRP